MEGLAFLSKGLAPTLLRAFPTNAVTFAVVTWVIRLADFTTENSAKIEENINIVLGYLSAQPPTRLYCLDDGSLGNVSVTVTFGKQHPKQSLSSSDFWIDDGDYHWHERNVFI